MKFYTNSLQYIHKTTSHLEVLERLKDILTLLDSHKILIKIESMDFIDLLTNLPHKDISYIKNILKHLKQFKYEHCSFCSWKNTIDKKLTKINCKMCGMDISNINDRYGYLDVRYSDTSIHINTFKVIQNMLSCLNKALVDNIKDNQLCQDIMLVTRPPGHHSSIDVISGFCYLNWTYIISQYLINKLKNKVCIIDLDLHHGNGTEKMVAGNMNTLFIDFHYYDGSFYPKTGDDKKYVADNIININMEKDSDDLNYLSKLEEQFSVITKFIPDVFIISMGCDIIIGDNFNIMKCSHIFYKKVYDILQKIFKKKIIMVLEGGYNKDNITQTIKNFI